MACQRLDQRTGPQLSHRLDLRSRVDLDFDSTYESGGPFCLFATFYDLQNDVEYDIFKLTAIEYSTVPPKR